MTRPDHCELCERPMPGLTKHHLIPRTRHNNKRNKKNFSREEIHTRVAWLCRPCHKQVHAVLSEKTLEQEFNTLAELAAYPEIKKFTDWIRTKPLGTHVTVKASKSKR